MKTLRIPPARLFRCLLAVGCLACLVPMAYAHNVSPANANFVAGVDSVEVALFVYLGAKHMVTGFDHLLYLFGILFWVRTWRDAVVFVSLFALGHSVTLIAGVSAGWQVNASLVDALIGFSVLYKAIENVGGFKLLFGVQPYVRIAVLGFGLIHGLGLATKLQAVYNGGEGFLVNLLSFNLGVELGQLCALALLLLLINGLRSVGMQSQGFGVNLGLMSCGATLVIYHLTQIQLGA